MTERHKRERLRAGDGMTLMIVPHNQKHVIKLRLNFRVLYFLATLMMLMLAVAGASVFTVEWFRQEREKEELTAMGWENKIWQFHHGQEQLIEYAHNLREHGLSFYRQVWGDAEFLHRKTSYSSPNQYLENTIRYFNHALRFITLREQSFQAIPLGWPVGSGFISSAYGQRTDPFALQKDFHTGYDFAAGTGTPIYATADGTVMKSGGGEGGLGLHVRLLHKFGFVTVYGHCSKLKVKQDQKVKRGEVIALLGRTGNATGPHVHYEVRLRQPTEGGYEIHLNPWTFIRENPP